MESSSNFAGLRSFALRLKIEKRNTGGRVDVYKVLENVPEEAISYVLSIYVSPKFLR